MQPRPKFNPGDTVLVNIPGDVDHNRIFKVEGLSPSTQKKRTPHRCQWRYSLIGSDGYFNEDELILVKGV